VAAVNSPGLKSRDAAWLCCLLGVVFFLPKLGRTPNDFTFFDELQNVRSTSEMLRGARLFVYNPINLILAHYPGLHVLVAAVARATGLSLFGAANSVLVTARVLLMASLFVIFRRLLGSPRVASIAVLLYAANPAYLYFDAQFSYESLALPLAVTVVALGMSLGSNQNLRRIPLAVASTLLIGAVIVTHHVTAYTMTAMLLLFGGLIRVCEPQARPIARALLGLGAVAAAGAAAWAVFVAPETWHYLAPGIESTLKTIPKFLSGHSSVRAPFAQSPLPTPVYELISSLLSVVLALTAFVAGTWLVRRERRSRGQMIGSIVLGAFYFVSLPLQLLQVSSATPIAPRIWEVSFIGLAPLAAIAATWLINRRRLLGWSATILGIFIMLMGGAVIRSGENIRFPGQYLPSGGPRAVTPDTIAAARWLLQSYGTHRVTMADVTLSSVFGAYALATPASYQNFGYRPWQVFFAPTLTATGRYELNRSGTEFVVVDLRVTRYRPFGGYYFSPYEPSNQFSVVPAQDIAKFNTSPFFERVYDNGNIIIYHYSPTAAPVPALSVGKAARGARGLALIAGQLTPSGKGAKIAALRKSGGFAFAFKALEPGSAVIDWYQLPPKAKPVLVAAGHLTFASAGTATMTLKLTATGGRLLKHAKQLKLIARGTFTPSSKVPITTTRTFILKR
jgi:NO-binding membrane sensor protein with MHYT domain